MATTSSPRSSRKIKPPPRSLFTNRTTDLRGTVKGLYQLYNHSPRLLLSLTNLHPRDAAASSSTSSYSSSTSNTPNNRRTTTTTPPPTSLSLHRTAPRIIQRHNRTPINTETHNEHPKDFHEEGNIISVASSISDPGSTGESFENTREAFEAALHALPSVHLPPWLPSAERPYLEGPALESAAALAAGAEVVFDWETVRDDLSVITNGRALRERVEDKERIGGVVWKGPTVSTNGMPHNSNLLPSERKLCSVLRLKPTQYLTIKHRLLVAAAAFLKSNNFQPSLYMDDNNDETKCPEEQQQQQPPQPLALMTPVTGSPPSSRSRRVSSTCITPLPRSPIGNVTPPSSTGKQQSSTSVERKEMMVLSGSSPPAGVTGTRTLGKADAQKMCRIDVNKTAKIWEYMRSRNWL